MGLLVNVYKIIAKATTDSGEQYEVTERIGIEPGTAVDSVLRKFELRLCEKNKKTMYVNIEVLLYELIAEDVYI